MADRLLMVGKIETEVILAVINSQEHDSFQEKSHCLPGNHHASHF